MKFPRLKVRKKFRSTNQFELINWHEDKIETLSRSRHPPNSLDWSSKGRETVQTEEGHLYWRVHAQRSSLSLTSRPYLSHISKKRILSWKKNTTWLLHGLPSISSLVRPVFEYLRRYCLLLTTVRILREPPSQGPQPVSVYSPLLTSHSLGFCPSPPVREPPSCPDRPHSYHYPRGTTVPVDTTDTFHWP
jgi:hypothetical protein